MKKTPMIYKIRVTGNVLETAHATRQVKVEGLVLTFGREPVYLHVDHKLPEKLTADPNLEIQLVDAAPDGAPVLSLKAERVQ